MFCPFQTVTFSANGDNLLLYRSTCFCVLLQHGKMVHRLGNLQSFVHTYRQATKRSSNQAQKGTQSN